MRSRSRKLVIRRTGARLVRPALSRLQSLQQRVAFLNARLDHALLRGLPLAPVVESATTVLSDLEQLDAGLRPYAGRDPSGQVFDALSAVGSLVARTREILDVGHAATAHPHGSGQLT